MTNRATLKDVAARAGVSYQTVSKVLNRQASVAPETEELIWQVVAELDYRPNVAARTLRKSASYLIGYSWTPQPPDRANAILDQFLTSTAEAAEAAGYHLLLFPSHKALDQTATYRDLVHSGRVDGFILTTTNYDDPRIPLLQALRFPFVAFGRANPEWDFAYVDVDGRAGVCAATEHLIEQGHQRIALLTWPEGSRVGTAREKGYHEAMDKAGLPVDTDWLLRGAGDFETGVRYTTTLLQLPENKRPTAVVAVDDHLAMGAMQAAQQAHLVVGRDFGVIGFDDTPGIQHLTPPLTSVRQPIWQVGQLIVKLLIELIQGKTPQQAHINLAPRLIVRQSSVRV
ncbi:MAG: LacI family DNA-binding transcriptional regulator [Caldilineaceae bacterium]